MANKKKKKKSNKPKTAAAPATDKLAKEKEEFEASVEKKTKPASSKPDSAKPASAKGARNTALDDEENVQAVRNRSGWFFIAGGIAIFAICSFIQANAGSSMFSLTYAATEDAVLKTLVNVTFVPGWVLTVGLITLGVITLVQASKNKGKGKTVIKSKARAKDPKKANKKPNIFRRFIEYLKQVRLEIKRTTWPTKNEVLNMTIIVIVALLFFGAFIFIIDFIMVEILNLYSGLAPDISAVDVGALDPGALDPGAVDPGAVDPGAVDPGAVDPGAADAANGADATGTDAENHG